MLPRVMVIPGSDGEVKARMEGGLTSQAVGVGAEGGGVEL